MKGNVVPAFVIVFAVGAVAASTVTGVAVSGISNLFTGASHSTDAQWVENTLGGVIVNKCQETNQQDPSPQQLNYSHSFNNLDNLSVRRDANNKKEYLELNYESSSTSALLTNADVFDFSRFVCVKLKLNGTRPDGSKIPRSETIELDTGNSLKFRIFETKYNGRGISIFENPFDPDYKNITIQVRQD